MRKLFSLLLAGLLTVTAVACQKNTSNSNGGNSTPESVEKVTLPDYDSVTADQMIFNAWFAPPVSRENFEDYKACGFNYMFLMGQNVGDLGSSKMFEAMDLCEELDIKVYIDVTRNEASIMHVIDRLVEYKCFVGFNYDEPVIHSSSLNGTTGIVELRPFIQTLHTKYPQVEFLINLNPSSNINFPWGTDPFTYNEYMDALSEYTFDIFDDSETRNWLSCDDYPLYVDNSAKNPYYLKTTWLENLEYLAMEKRDSERTLFSNFFIQSMPFGVGAKSRDRVPSYQDLSLQLYSVMAFGYDAVSFFCYGTPPSSEGGEFTKEQNALLDRDGNKTQIYYDSKKLISEVNRFANTYMQFNDRWMGVLPVLGSNNLAEDDMYYNNSFDCLHEPLTLRRMKNVESVTATEDSIVGYMQDKDGNPGYMFVNYNDTTYEKKSDVTVKFKGYNKAYVYINGIKEDVSLTDNTLNLNLDIGEGIFVIPYVG